MHAGLVERLQCVREARAIWYKTQEALSIWLVGALLDLCLDPGDLILGVRLVFLTGVMRRIFINVCRDFRNVACLRH